MLAPVAGRSACLVPRPRHRALRTAGFRADTLVTETRPEIFEHAEYTAVRQYLPAPYQDVLDFAYYSGWQKREILGLEWDEVDERGGVVRLSPARSKTRVGRVLPISPPIGAVLSRRRARRRAGDPHVFTRDETTVRAWRRAWPAACRKAGVPGRLLHDCRRTAARNLVRAGVPERVAMQLTGHKTRAIFDRYCIVNEADLHQAGAQLVAYLAERAGGRVETASCAGPARRSPFVSSSGALRHGPAAM